MLKQPTLYISSSEATQHIHRFQAGITKARKDTTAPTAPTFNAEAAYAVHFFQRGYSAHPQILNYDGRKHTTTQI